MEYRLFLLCAMLFTQSYGIQARHKTADTVNSMEDGLSLQQQLSVDKTTERYLALQQNKAESKNNDTYTAGNTRCRLETKCDFHKGASYKWCYTDYSDNWDYCCTGACEYHGAGYLWCQSGSKWQVCGGSGWRDIQGRLCYDGHPCGMHQEVKKNTYFWCYVDMGLNWGKCCAPSSKCEFRGQTYNWCYTGSKNDTDWQTCILP